MSVVTPDQLTIAIRLPTAAPPAATGAPAFTVDGPLAGKRVGVRTDLAWRSWMLIAGRWDEYLRRDGATTLAIQTAAQVGQEGSDDRAAIDAWSGEVDCGIVGLGTCGSCTSFSVHDAVTLESHEKPSVVVVCSEFETHARNMARFLGHPDLKVLVLPYPLEARPEPELLQIADEYYPQALALLGGADVSGVLTTERVEISADPVALYERSLADGWGDGAPILPATDERVLELLAATPLPPDYVVGALPPQYGVATVELVAVNAAMAGCEPRAFPLVLASLEAILVPEFNAFGLTTTTSSVFPMLVVNGPTRAELGIDHRAGCMGGAAGRGSMTIGRAVSLCLRNIGGQRAGETSRTVFGQPARFGMCFGEWEERSPWPSLAERRGFTADEEVVTAHGGKGTYPLADINNDDPRDLLLLIAKSLAFPLSNLYLGGSGQNGEVVLAINPVWADRFAAPFPEVESLQQFLWEQAWQPVDLWPAANQEILRGKDRVAEDGRVHLVRRPDQFVPVVCGGLGSLHAVAPPSFGESQLQSAAAVRL